MTAPNMFPFLRYRNARKAIEWLGLAFGFEVHSLMDAEDGTVAHAELKLGPGIIMVGEARDDALGVKSPNELDAVTGGIYVYVEDVDAHYARASKHGAEMVFDIADMDYGAREYTARDLEGHLWSFGTYQPVVPD